MSELKSLFREGLIKIYFAGGRIEVCVGRDGSSSAEEYRKQVQEFVDGLNTYDSGQFRSFKLAFDGLTEALAAGQAVAKNFLATENDLKGYRIFKNGNRWGFASRIISKKITN